MARLRTLPALVAATAVALTACGGGSTPGAVPEPEPDDGPEPVEVTRSADGTGAEDCPTADEPAVGELETTRLYIEHNATDSDTGVHAVFGGEAWSVMCVSYPDGTPMLVADPLGDFDTLAVSDLLWE